MIRGGCGTLADIFNLGEAWEAPGDGTCLSQTTTDRPTQKEAGPFVLQSDLSQGSLQERGDPWDSWRPSDYYPPNHDQYRERKEL